MFWGTDYAANFSPEELEAAVAYAHTRRAKVYLTLNILIHDRELPDAARYLVALYQAGVDGVLVQDVGLATLARQEPELEETWQAVAGAVNQALEMLEQMRLAEGAALASDLAATLAGIRAEVARIQAQAPLLPQLWREKVSARLAELVGETGVDEARLAQEVAFLAERRDLSEELARLESHLAQFDQTLTALEPVGRKQEFLLQEMLREANTIGSKAGDLLITQAVLEIKGYLERLREQVHDWSRDGRTVLYNSYEAGVSNIRVLPLSADRKPVVFRRSPANEVGAQFSPDDHFVAFASAISGRDEVYVAAFGTPGRTQIVSSGGGRAPRWRRDGKELFYLSVANELMAVDVRGAGDVLEFGTPRQLFQAHPFWQGWSPYFVSPDGQSFRIYTFPEEVRARIILIQNWTVLLPR